MTDCIDTGFRWMIPTDLPAVLKMNGCFSAQDFINTLGQKKSMGLIIEDQSYRSLGYLVAKKVRLNECRVLDIAVHPRFRHSGLGRKMIEFLKIRNKRILVNVPEPNLGAQLFFKQLGFECISIYQERYIFVWRT